MKHKISERMYEKLLDNLREWEEIRRDTSKEKNDRVLGMVIANFFADIIEDSWIKEEPCTKNTT